VTRCECHTDRRYHPIHHPCPHCTAGIDARERAREDARIYPED
jgi:hypothetical protein